MTSFYRLFCDLLGYFTFSLALPDTVCRKRDTPPPPYLNKLKNNNNNLRSSQRISNPLHVGIVKLGNLPPRPQRRYLKHIALPSSQNLASAVSTHENFAFKFISQISCITYTYNYYISNSSRRRLACNVIKAV